MIWMKEQLENVTGSYRVNLYQSRKCSDLLHFLCAVSLDFTYILSVWGWGCAVLVIEWSTFSHEQSVTAILEQFYWISCNFKNNLCEWHLTSTMIISCVCLTKKAICEEKHAGLWSYKTVTLSLSTAVEKLCEKKAVVLLHIMVI